jgi:hypothetical protein
MSFSGVDGDLEPKLRRPAARRVHEDYSTRVALWRVMRPASRAEFSRVGTWYRRSSKTSIELRIRVVKDLSPCRTSPIRRASSTASRRRSCCGLIFSVPWVETTGSELTRRGEHDASPIKGSWYRLMSWERAGPTRRSRSGRRRVYLYGLGFRRHFRHEMGTAASGVRSGRPRGRRASERRGSALLNSILPTFRFTRYRRSRGARWKPGSGIRWSSSSGTRSPTSGSFPVPVRAVPSSPSAPMR